MLGSTQIGFLSSAAPVNTVDLHLESPPNTSGLTGKSHRGIEECIQEMLYKDPSRKRPGKFTIRNVVFQDSNIAEVVHSSAQVDSTDTSLSSTQILTDESTMK